MTAHEAEACIDQQSLDYFQGVGRAAMAAIAASGESYHTVFLRYVDEDSKESLHEWLDSHYRVDFVGFTVGSEVEFVPDTAHEVICIFDKSPRVDGIATDDDLSMVPVRVRR